MDISDAKTPMARMLRLAALIFACTVVADLALPGSRQAWAEVKHKSGPTKEQIKKQRREIRQQLKPTCPPGTEQIGDLPPEGAALWCEYPTNKGPLTHGNYYKWNSKGTLTNEGEFYQGKKHGTWTTYNRDGKIKKEETWFDGERKEQVKFDRKGKPIKKDEKVEKDKAAAKARNKRPNMAK